MTTIDMPVTPGFTDCNFYLEANTQTFTSPFTRATQRQELAGARWRASYSLPAMTRRQAAPWIAFFLKLKGRVNTFNAYDPDWKTPLGPAGGTPLVKGGSQTGISLLIDGCTPNTLFLHAGDPFGVNGELKRLTADATANGSGEVTLYFEPYLRSSPPDSAPITVIRPTCTMILTDDNQGSYTCDKNGIYQPKTFTAYEVFS